ncbi:hypothetical protein COMNV_00689 [Commensalibacter sp. Nvir]|uniref:CHAP domain-containing protein n=1 Tax=Commensalibacter sp. Nvir TaxID=3069817 RepID=UPI002D665C93|nr:hypothetical protein COMNV_00689 [Commensalibacter sp. Nvir]
MFQSYVTNHVKFKLTSFCFIFICLNFFSSPTNAKTTYQGIKKRTNTVKRINLSTFHHPIKIGYSNRNSFNHKTYRIRYTHKTHKGGHVIQCVAFARHVSDVQLKGNARDWWNNAEGVYEKGYVPQPNSILSFKSTRRMPYGHVAVVKEVVNPRTIIIDQSHWAQRGISRNVPVIDVSPNNDWSSVRVAINRKKDSFGSIYPTHGFIYPNQVSQTTNRKNYWQANAKIWTSEFKNTSTQVALAPNISNNFFEDGPDRNIK